MAETEHVYTIPLRIVKSVPRWRRTNRAMSEVRDYLSKHMKTPAEDVKIDKSLNEALWARGDEKPPQKIRVRAVKFDDGGVEAEFAGKQ
ncbi:MAG: 50S ribosomal protein L31e [Methanotrichaceae archaeon]